MIKKIIFFILIIPLITGCNSNKKIEKIEEGIKTMQIKINNTTYNVNLENNKTVDEFISRLPLEYTMQDLNANEKYVYLDYQLPTNSIDVGDIKKGDIMLYGNNCLVIFYKSFKTPYSYTKIGNIENLAQLDENDIDVIFKIS